MAEKAKFPLNVKIKCLLWSQRHCCLCEKLCGVDIEVAHIDRTKSTGKNAIDNAIPLCYDCHAQISHYNDEEPKGNKYNSKELKARREQVYEKYTRHLVPPVHFAISQNQKDLERLDIGFDIYHPGEAPPIEVLVNVDLYLGKTKLPKIPRHYSREETWKLNPGMGFHGHFDGPLKKDLSEPNDDLKAIVNVTIIDQHDRHHELKPVSWKYDKEGDFWFADP